MNCGRKASEGDRYCLQCGRKLDQVSQRNLAASEDTVQESLLRQWVNAPEKTEKKKKSNYVLMIACGVVMIAVAIMLFWPVYGPWSEWLAGPVMKADGYDYETADFYSYREKTLRESTERDDSLGQLVEVRDTYSEYGDWSDWQTETVEASQLCEVEEAQHYRYRTATTTEAYSEWSDWSDWSDRLVAPSENVQVESRTAFFYSAYCYRCNECGRTFGSIDLVMLVHVRKKGYSEEAMAPFKKYLAGGYGVPVSDALKSGGFSYQKETLTSINSPLTVDTSDSPYKITYNGEVWYTEVPEPVVVLQCKTKTRSLEEKTEYSDWTYSTSPVTGDANVQVEPVKRIRYRIREKQTVYVYETWGSWSEWQKTPVEENQDREVEKMEHTRWRKKSTLLRSWLE